MTFDSSEVKGLEQVLAKAAAGAPKDVAPVVERGALNIKRDAAKRASGLKHAPAYPRAITYDLFPSLRGPAAEIGPDKKRRQGALGNVLEHGTVNNPPRPHLRPAADAELPRFEKALEAVAVKLLEGR